MNHNLNMSQLSILLTQIIVVISVFVVDISLSSDSSAAFSSANKVASHDSSLLSNRHKRRVSDDAFMGDLNEAQQALEVLKRAPGWGKRFYTTSSEPDSDSDQIWAKFQDDDDDSQDGVMKRAPGWGKRAPGWGKRAPGWGKRAPGWGKRAPGWGKRAPGWGKRSADDVCSNMDRLAESFMYRLQEIRTIRSERCGNVETVHQPFRK